MHGLAARINIYHLAALILAATLMWLAYRIVGDTGLGRIAFLESQIEQETRKADVILQRNQLLAEQIALISKDEGQTEFLARYHFGMIKPGEIFIQSDR